MARQFHRAFEFVVCALMTFLQAVSKDLTGTFKSDTSLAPVFSYLVALSVLVVDNLMDTVGACPILDRSSNEMAISLKAWHTLKYVN